MNVINFVDVIELQASLLMHIRDINNVLDFMNRMHIVLFIIWVLKL